MCDVDEFLFNKVTDVVVFEGAAFFTGTFAFAGAAFTEVALTGTDFFAEAAFAEVAFTGLAAFLATDFALAIGFLAGAAFLATGATFLGAEVETFALGNGFLVVAMISGNF